MVSKTNGKKKTKSRIFQAIIIQIINAAYKFKKHFTLIVNFPSKENYWFGI